MESFILLPEFHNDVQCYLDLHNLNYDLQKYVHPFPYIVLWIVRVQILFMVKLCLYALTYGDL